MPKRYRDAEFEGMPRWIVHTWTGLIRFVAPLLVILVLLQKAGFLDADEIIFSLFGG